MSATTRKPWDALRVAPPVTKQPIGVGSFCTVAGAGLTISYMHRNGANLRFACGGTEWAVGEKDCRQLGEFFTELADQFAGK